MLGRSPSARVSLFPGSSFRNTYYYSIEDYPSQAEPGLHRRLEILPVILRFAVVPGMFNHLTVAERGEMGDT